MDTLSGSVERATFYSRKRLPRPDHQSRLPPARSSFAPICDSLTKSVAHPYPPHGQHLPNPNYLTTTTGSIEVDFHTPIYAVSTRRPPHGHVRPNPESAAGTTSPPSPKRLPYCHATKSYMTGQKHSITPEAFSFAICFQSPLQSD